MERNTSVVLEASKIYFYGSNEEYRRLVPGEVRQILPRFLDGDTELNQCVSK